MHFIKLVTIVVLSVIGHHIRGQNLYFPPKTTPIWDTLTPQDAGWCNDDFSELYTFLDSTKTKAFIVLQGGKRVIEAYFDGFKADSAWYWASAGKSLTAFLVGLAQQQGQLSIEDPVNQYLNNGWTSCTSQSENLIKIRHQLEMSTGFNDALGNLNCTTSACLHCIHQPGSSWSYHNAPYTLLRNVLENATNQGINLYLFQQLTQKIGFTGIYAWLPDNLNVFFSTPRSMARFGLLMLAQGVWENDTIMSDQVFFNQMINQAQPQNQAYGYLWWLNNTTNYMVPYVPFSIPGNPSPSSPMDMYSAIGKNSQILNVIPSADLVVVRLGENSDTNISVPWNYNEEMMRRLNDVICHLTTPEHLQTVNEIRISNQSDKTVHIESSIHTIKRVRQYDLRGVLVRESIPPSSRHAQLSQNGIKPGVYILIIEDSQNNLYRKKIHRE